MIKALRTLRLIDQIFDRIANGDDKTALAELERVDERYLLAKPRTKISIDYQIAKLFLDYKFGKVIFVDELISNIRQSKYNPDEKALLKNYVNRIKEAAISFDSAKDNQQFREENVNIVNVSRTLKERFGN